MKMKRTVAGMVTMGVLLFPGVAFANDKAHNEKSSNEKSSNEKTHNEKSSNEKTSTDDKHDSAAASFDEIKAKCVKAITDRQASLDRAATNVLKTSDPHDGVLTTLITNSQNALAALLVEVNADTGDLAALKQDCQRIVTDNRIYALRLPQINAVMSIDRLNASLVKFGTLHDQLVAAIAAANSSSDPDAAEATATLAELEAKLASAKATLDGIDINALLAITPADYNANKNVLQPYLQAVRSAHSDVKQAAKLAKHIAKLLEPGDDTEHDG